MFNGVDDFPLDARCQSLSNADCSACGVGCPTGLYCARQTQSGVFIGGACEVAQAELCNGADDDGDSVVDEGPPADNQRGVCAGALKICGPTGGYVNPDYSAVEGYVEGGELCDGLDNDCDGTTDVGASDALPFYPDFDSDGFGTGTPIFECNQPSGYSAFDTDCNDSDFDINPGAAEICDGIDNDCNQLVDDSVIFTDYYLDSDGDGFGDLSNSISACVQPSGYSTNSTDCDDSNMDVNPSSTELCNGIDDDCDGTTDVGASDAVAYYPDLDLDGFGSGAPIFECTQPSGYSAVDTDCDDLDVDVNPGAAELCDGIDNDCNQLVDDISSQLYYTDSDGDGFGDPNTGMMACAQPSGTVTNGDDCDDSDPAIYLSAPELCDGIDNDCDGYVDEPSNNAPLWYYDGDGDGYGGETTVYSCAPPTDYISIGGDCDDSDFLTNPDAADLCDGYDNDCDGVVDSAADCPCNYETYGDHAYLFCNSAQNWYSALSGCEYWGYSLAAVNSSAEQSWLQGRSYSYSTSAWWWIGFYDINAPYWQEPASGWEWTTGEPVTDTFWAGGQPDNYYNEDCAHFYPNGTWNDLECSYNYYGSIPIFFICESLDP